MVGLAGLLWCLSAALAAWWWAPCFGSVVGAVAGCVLATGLALRPTPRRYQVAAPLWLALVGALFVIGRWGAPMPSAGTAITAWNGLACALVSGTVVAFFHCFSHPLLLVIECALFALPWVGLLAGHRGGHLDQPVVLIEPAWALGFDPFRLFATVGLALGTLLSLLIACRRATRVGWRSGLFVLLAGTLGALLMPAEHLFRLSAEAPEEQASEAAPAASKPDTPLAVVVLYSDYDPELGTYHFRAQAPGPPAKSELAHSLTPLHYRVAEMVPQSEPLTLGWNPEVLPAQSANEGSFARLYEIRSRVQTRPLAEMLDLPGAGSVPSGPFAGLAASIVPEEERAYPLRAALRVKLWMEQNRAQAENEPADSGTVEDCLDENRPVGQKTYTLACQKLLESLGLTPRLAQGFAVRADQKGEGSYLLISESNQRSWLELWLDQGGPVVIDLYPLQGPADSDGPQNRDLQHQLGEMARARGGGQPLPGLSAGALGFILFLLILALGGHAIKAYRRWRVLWCAPSRLPVWAMVVVLDRLAEVGEVRRPGETRLEFAHRMKNRVPSMEPLTHLHQKACLGPSRAQADRTGAGDNAVPLMKAALRECGRAFPSALLLAGRLHPFAWMKVS